MENEGSPKRFLMGNFIIQDQWKNQEQDGRLSEGHITDPRNSRMVETSRRQGGMEASSEGGLGPEVAAVP
jgi:hypothetical protein